MRFRFVTLLSGVALVAGAVMVVGPAAAGAAPAHFQMPFPCGQQWESNTYTGHDPQNATDLNRANDDGDPVAASAAGTVSVVGDKGGTSYGLWIEITHSGGWRTRYAHLSKQRVGVGDLVSPGQRIGDVGSTGGSTGAHLHHEQRTSAGAQRITFNGAPIHYFGRRTYTSRNNCAAQNPYTPRGICGDDYKVIDWAALGTVGAVYLTYNKGNNCVATIKHSSLGVATATAAFLQVEGSSMGRDSGNYGYFAGPVTKAAAGKCVKWGGSIGSVSYTSPFEHCG